MIKHVGLCFVVQLNGNKLVVLQKRGCFNFEKTGPESWVGACQPTVHGKVEEGESPIQAIIREAWEELGSHQIVDVMSSRTVEIGPFDGGKDDGAYFVVESQLEIFSTLSLHAGSGGIQFASVSEVQDALDLRVFPKTFDVGKVPGLVMFPDDKAFALRALSQVELVSD